MGESIQEQKQEIIEKMAKHVIALLEVKPLDKAAINKAMEAMCALDMMK